MDNQRGHLHFCHSADSGLFSIKKNREGSKGRNCVKWAALEERSRGMQN